VNAILRVAVNHPTAAKVLMLGIIAVGLYTAKNIQRESFPKVDLEAIRIIATWPGATPEEVEEGIVIKIEDVVHGIPGVEGAWSTTTAGRASIFVDLKASTDPQKALDDVRNAVSEIAHFPADMEPISVTAITNRQNVIGVVVHGDVSPTALRRAADQVHDDLLTEEHVTQVSVDGIKNREIAIEVLPHKIREYGLTLNDVTKAIRGANVEISAGAVRSRREDILLKAGVKHQDALSIGQLVIAATPAGAKITLADVATVREQETERTLFTRFNGQPAALIQVTKTETEDILKIVAAVRKYVSTRKGSLPGNIEMSIWRDRTIMLHQRMNLLAENGLMALALIFLALWVFTQLRLSFWVALGLPVAILGTAILIQFTGVTLHMISLFGILLVSGILVDDAIVVGENVYAHLERGADAKTAAIEGAKEVLPAVTASILTTIIAFIPFFYMGGHIGKFVRSIPIVVICALLVSLIECLIILPSHLAHWLKIPDRENPSLFTRIRLKVDAAIERYMRQPYQRLLHMILRFHWQMVAFGIALFMITVGVISGGFIKILFFPAIDADNIQAEYLLLPGTPEHINNSLAKRIETTAGELNKELMEETGSDEDVIRRRLATVGGSTSEKGLVRFELMPGETRTLSAEAISQRLRKKVGPVPEARWLTIGPRRRGPFGKPVQVDLISNDQHALEVAAERLKKEIASHPGTYDISDDLVTGKREVVLQVNALGRSLGLNRQLLAGQVRQGFYGNRVEVLQRGSDELEMWVRFPADARQTLGQLARLRIRTPAGGEVALREVASWTTKRGLATIKRYSQGRKITVAAMVDPTEGNPEDILNDMKNRVVPELLADHHRLRATFEGQSRERRKMLSGFKKALPWALLGMFAVLILVFGSYAQATLVMVMIPLGLVGAVMGHFIVGKPLTVLSLWGVVALGGVIVNDSIVFVDAINRNLAAGKGLVTALHEAGTSRFRPIVLTTLTTAAGLMPLILEQSRQAQFLIPMAISLAFGLLFGTIFTLGVLPAGFACINDIRRFTKWLRTGSWPAAEIVEPKVEG